MTRDETDTDDRRRPNSVAGNGPRPRPIVLVVLDGFGIGGDPATDAIAAAPMPTWRALLREWPHADPPRVRGRGRPAARPDGQLRGRPPQPGRGPARPPGPAADRRRDRRWQLLRSPRPARGVPACRSAGWTPPHHQPDRSGRRPRQRPASGRDRGPRRTHRRPRGPRPRAARWARHAAAIGARVRRRRRAPPRGRPPGRAHRVDRRALFRDGSRQSLGPCRARL